MPVTTQYPEPTQDIDDESSSEDDDDSFRFWGSGSGSSASLSKYMAKREREAERDLKRQLAQKNMELRRDNSVRDSVGGGAGGVVGAGESTSVSGGSMATASVSPPLERKDTTPSVTGPPAPLDRTSVNGGQGGGVNRSSSASRADVSQGLPRTGSRDALEQPRTSTRVSETHLAAMRGSRPEIFQPQQAPLVPGVYGSGISLSGSTFATNGVAPPPTPAGGVPYPETYLTYASSEDFIPPRPIQAGATLPIFDSAALLAYQQATVASGDRLPLQSLQREFLDAEPEIPDSVPAVKILRRIGAYRNWSEIEIQADALALEANRIRTVRDIRDLSADGWREVKDLLPLVKDLLIKEVCKGRSLQSRIYESMGIPRSALVGSTPMAGSGLVYAAPSEASNFDVRAALKAPVSTPAETPDFNATRRVFHPRNAAW